MTIENGMPQRQPDETARPNFAQANVQGNNSNPRLRFWLDTSHLLDEIATSKDPSVNKSIEVNNRSLVNESVSDLSKGIDNKVSRG